jgi:hypothetical protein
MEDFALLAEVAFPKSVASIIRESLAKTWKPCLMEFGCRHCCRGRRIDARHARKHRAVWQGPPAIRPTARQFSGDPAPARRGCADRVGLTLEFPLHLWTYRLKVLQGEAGGRMQQAALVARNVCSGTQETMRVSG